MIYDYDKNNVKVEKKDYIYAKEKVRILNKEFDGLYEGIDQRPIKPTVALKKLFYMIPDKDIFTSVCVFSELKEIFDSIDINGDGSISFGEFCKMMKNIMQS